MDNALDGGRRASARYRLALGWAFTLFSVLRVLSYLPTLLLIWQQGAGHQHSLLTWCTWLVANLTMAGWLHEHHGRPARQAVAMTLANAAMCAAAVGLIAWFRI